MPNSKVLSEIDSTFSDTLTKLLVQFNNDDDSNNKGNNNDKVNNSSSNNNKKGGKSLSSSSIQIIKNRFNVSVKSMEFLLHVCNNAIKPDWEKHVRFSLFIKFSFHSISSTNRQVIIMNLDSTNLTKIF